MSRKCFKKINCQNDGLKLLSKILEKQDILTKPLTDREF